MPVITARTGTGTGTGTGAGERGRGRVTGTAATAALTVVATVAMVAGCGDEPRFARAPDACHPATVRDIGTVFGKSDHERRYPHLQRTEMTDGCAFTLTNADLYLSYVHVPLPEMHPVMIESFEDAYGPDYPSGTAHTRTPLPIGDRAYRYHFPDGYLRITFHTANLDVGIGYNPDTNPAPDTPERLTAFARLLADHLEHHTH